MALRVAFLTDVHFGPPARFRGALRKLSGQADPLTRRFVARMNEFERPELVVNLGDVIEDQDAELDRLRYIQFMDALSPLTVPVLHVAGNHDTVHLADEELGQLWSHVGPLFYSRDHGGLHFVTLRTVETRDAGVRLPDEQLAWLEADLRATRLPVVVLMHHPAGEMNLGGNRWFEHAPHLCRVANRRALRRMLENSGKVVAVFNGHAHWNHLSVVSGIPYVTVQSLIENVDDDAPGRPARAWAVAEIAPQRLSVRVHGEQPARYDIELPRRR